MADQQVHHWHEGATDSGMGAALIIVVLVAVLGIGALLFFYSGGYFDGNRGNTTDINVTVPDVTPPATTPPAGTNY